MSALESRPPLAGSEKRTMVMALFLDDVVKVIMHGKDMRLTLVKNATDANIGGGRLALADELSVLAIRTVAAAATQKCRKEHKRSRWRRSRSPQDMFLEGAQDLFMI